MKPPNSPTAYISAASLGYLGSVKRYSARVAVSAVPYGAFQVPLFLQPPPCTDDSAALLLAAIDLLRNSKNSDHKNWVTHARKTLRIGIREQEEVPA